MEMRTAAAILNGSLVMAMYLLAWGTPSPSIAGLELVLAAGAAVSTGYALRSLRSPVHVQRLIGRIVQACVPA